MRRIALIVAIALLAVAPSTVQAQVYGDNTSLVNDWYQTFLGRPADPNAVIWVGELNSGTPADRVLATILSSDEFYRRAGRTPEGFITLLFTDLLQRPPTPAELDFWVRRMYTEDRATIADEILTQNPGVWVGATTVVTPPVTVTPPVVVQPGIDWDWHHHWDRDRHWDWDRHHDIHEYRRPEFHEHEEHHEHHR